MAISSITAPTQIKNAITSKVHSAYNYSVFEILFSLGTTLLDKVTMFLEFSSDLGVITQSNTYNYSVLNITKMRRDVSKIVQSKIKTVCPLNFSIPANTSFPDTNSFQMYRVCVVYGDSQTLRTDWFYAGAGVFQKFHERKGNYIDYMVHLGAYTPPAPILNQEYLVFDFDFQATAKQTLRDSIYLANYIDGGVSMAQTIASQQPIIDATGLKFDGVEDFMLLGATGGKEIWFVCNNLDGTVFSPSDGLFSTVSTSDDYISGDAGSSNFRFLFASMKINNIAGFNFAPLANFKSVSQEMVAGASPLEIGNIARAFFWNGYIKRILIFDTALSEPRKTELQEYLALTYSL